MFITYYLLVYQTYNQIFSLGLFWTAFEAFWSRKITLNMGLYPACMEVITYYLKIRYQSVKTKLINLENQNLNHKGMQMEQCMQDVNVINVDLQKYNHYWRKYSASVLISYIPQILFEVFACLYLPMQTSVLVFGITLSINMISLVSQVCMFSAATIHKVCLVHSLSLSLSHPLFCTL